MTTILLTGVGAPGTAGTLYALRNNGEQKVRIIGVDTDKDAIGKYLIDKFYTVLSPQLPKYIPKLVQICEEEKVDVILPQTTAELQILSINRQELPSVAISNPYAIFIANNKSQVMKLFKEHGFPTPAYCLVYTRKQLEKVVCEYGYPTTPVVVKSPCSSGGRGVRILQKEKQGKFFSEKPNGLYCSLKSLLVQLGDYFPPVVVMEYLPGDEYTVDCFRGRDVKFAVPRKRLKIRDGITFDSVVELRKDLIDYSLWAAKEMDLKYAFGFQYKLDSKRVPKILECNPRVQGTMVASYFSGANIIWMAVTECLNGPVKETPVLRSGSRLIRYWGGVDTHSGYTI